MRLVLRILIRRVYLMGLQNTPNSASFGTLPNRGDDRWGKLVPISQYAAARMGRPSRPPPM